MLTNNDTIEEITNDYPPSPEFYEKYGIDAVRVENEMTYLAGNTALLVRIKSLQALLNEKIFKSFNYSKPKFEYSFLEVC